ncbi:YheC/YheD family protein [Thalassobacillus sp. B23F22_16]|uniref:YheC/YheD family protein n=1 Tax=Thalassobacillus sp. B23F22_16 TaxID=3459513 RepID=UPI00373F49DD
MHTTQEKQLSQGFKLTNTIIEAIDHFSLLVRERKINQSIFMFSSIVEGFETIDKTISTLIEIKKEKEKIEQSLTKIARLMEKGNFPKISEVLQFSLKPHFMTLKKKIKESTNFDHRQKVTVGIYYCESNPIEVYSEERIKALVKAGEKQGVNLLFFSSSDVDFEKKSVNASVFKLGKWHRTTNSFPDVISNIAVKPLAYQSQIERKLRKEVPFTGFGVGDKFHLYKKLIDSRIHVNLLVPFKIATEESVIHNFLNHYKHAVFKPILGKRGQNIFFVEKKESNYTVTEHKKKSVMSYENFISWLYEVILKKKHSYMVQQYIHSRTKDKEPFDIRAHVQKDGEGKWKLTKIYARIGNKKSILSNISRGGRTEELGSLFAREFGGIGRQYEKDIQKLALDLTMGLDKIHGFALSELGLDLAIDSNGRFWLYEVNNGPQSTYHENERAVNTIAYAVYIARNGLFLTNEFDKVDFIKGQFNARQTRVPVANLRESCSIGMLVDEKEVNNLTIACSYVANFEDVNFFYFTPKDIDFNEMLIRGHFYENKKWNSKVVNYPDVIYDRLRLRGINGYKRIYEDLEGIPFTNNFYGNSISKLEVYDNLSSISGLKKAIIPYQKVTRMRDIFIFLERYNKVILKPRIGSFANGVHFVEKVKTDEYFVAIGEKEFHLNESKLMNYLGGIINREEFLTQKYIESRTIDNQPFDIRVHMMKDGSGKWSFVDIYPRVGVYHAVILAMRKGGYIGEISGFLSRNFGRNNSNDLGNNIKELSHKIACEFENFYDHHLSEIGLDLAIDQELNLSLIEVNVNKPGFINCEFEIAKHAIPYAVYLAENNVKMDKLKS